MNPLDDAETPFVDLDITLNYYIDEYRILKMKKQKELFKKIETVIKHNEHDEVDLSMK